MPSHDPVASVVLALAIILIAAKIGGDLAGRAGQPAVLGELVFGVLLGNLSLAGLSFPETIKHDIFVDMLARLGVLILLFEIGLESTVGQMLKVGARALAVASLGTTASFALGWAAAAWLLPGAGIYAHVFLGATITATSIAISARVLQDTGRGGSGEARLILGAAVADDVFGLVILAVMGGLIGDAAAGRTPSLGRFALVLGRAAGFLVAALILGVLLSPRLFAAASRIRARGVLLAAGLSFCFFLSWAAGAIGLAPIIGAFAAGLILEDVHYREFVARGGRALGELVRPISDFLVPVFFVLLGMRADLRAFAEPSVAALAAALCLAAILGKLCGALGAVRARLNALAVGIGMMPRGEVSLIFASIGLSLIAGGAPVIDTARFSAIVVVVIVTTLLTPPSLKWALSRRC